MAIQNWSDEITVAELGDDPQFTDELTALTDSLEQKPVDVVLNFSAVSFINSSNVSQLLRLRKMMINHGRKLVLCDVNTQVWGVFLVTGLDKIFDFTNDIATALAMLQLAEADEDAES
jgi:anti-anti-sigma factor